MNEVIIFMCRVWVYFDSVDDIYRSPWADIDSTHPWSRIFRVEWETFIGVLSIFCVDNGVKYHIDVLV